jgi:hypothetical protein
MDSDYIDNETIMENIVTRLNTISCMKGVDVKDNIICDSDNPYIQYTIALLNEFIITDNGKCNYDNIKILENYGYTVSRGEYDSFGWLSGVITFPNNLMLIYG